jgi:hypothetical protein
MQFCFELWHSNGLNLQKIKLKCTVHCDAKYSGSVELLILESSSWGLENRSVIQ